MTRSEIAINKFKEGYNCAQSVFFCFKDKLNIDEDLVLKIASGFGGGMGRKQEVCGAISGGILVLGALYGRGIKDEKSKQENTYVKTREFIDKFKEKYNTINCLELLDGCKLLSQEGQTQFKSKQLIEKCYEYVEYAVKIIDDITEGKI